MNIVSTSFAKRSSRLQILASRETLQRLVAQSRTPFASLIVAEYPEGLESWTTDASASSRSYSSLHQQDDSDSSTSNASTQSSSVESSPPPKLKQIPRLPVLGSMVPFHSGLPPLEPNQINNWFRGLHEAHGPFYAFGMPGFGSGIDGTIHVVRDIAEMQKVLRSEGTYPSGAVETEWPIRQWMKERNYATQGLFGRGPEWKIVRSFLQKDLLAPASAREYIPGIFKGATRASQRFGDFSNVPASNEMSPQARSDRLTRYMNFSAMDMFAEVLFGGSGISDPGGITEQQYQEFCESAADGVLEMFNLMRDPWQRLLAVTFGITTPRVKRFQQNFNAVEQVARNRIAQFLVKLDGNSSQTLSEAERNSYLYKLLQRREESSMSDEAVIEIAVMMMVAALDTTASKLSWNVVQLAVNPELQQELYDQLDKAAQESSDSKSLPRLLLDPSRVPLLSAFVRETHRCTPALGFDLFKSLESPIEVHGTTLPSGSTVMFDCLTVQMDPNLVDDPTTFNPKRWYKEAVEERKGTPKAVIDHVFYSGPFSQGARRCPGSRVAMLEIQTFLAALLRDWRIEIPGAGDLQWSDIEPKLLSFVYPSFPEGIRFVPR